MYKNMSFKEILKNYPRGNTPGLHELSRNVLDILKTLVHREELQATNEDEITPRIVDKWKPKEGEPFYFIHESGIVCIGHWVEDYHKGYLYNLGNCFETEADARFCLDEFISKAFAKFHGQYPPGSLRG